MATNYPQALYVNVFDGVAGTLEFNSTPGSHAYTPVAGKAISDGRSVVIGDNHVAVLSVIPGQYPGGTAATWASNSSVAEWAWNESSNRLSLAVKGSLPAMTSGAIPSGWLMCERPWTVENAVGSLVIPYSFSSKQDVPGADGAPLNITPIYLVPYFGNYGTGKGVGDPTFTVTGGGIVNSAIGDAVVTLTFPKPLNPNQTLDKMSFSIPSTAGGSALALPQSIINGITITANKNSYDQVTSIRFAVPLSSAAIGVIKPGYAYNFPVTITQPLTFLNGNDYAASTVVLATGSTSIQIAASSTGPTLGVATVDIVPGQGARYASAYLNSDIFIGNIRLTYTASDPWGVYSARTQIGVFATSIYTNSGATSGTFTADFAVGTWSTIMRGPARPGMGGLLSEFAMSNPQYSVPNLNANGHLTSTSTVRAANPLSGSSTWGYADVGDYFLVHDGLIVYDASWREATWQDAGTGAGLAPIYSGARAVKLRVPFPPALLSSVSISTSARSAQGTGTLPALPTTHGQRLYYTWPGLTEGIPGPYGDLLVMNDNEVLEVVFNVHDTPPRYIEWGGTLQWDPGGILTFPSADLTTITLDYTDVLGNHGQMTRTFGIQGYAILGDE